MADKHVALYESGDLEMADHDADRIRELCRGTGRRALHERCGKAVATAESCTGGWIAKAITDIPGSSAVFRYGIVSYSNGAKESLLGVSKPTLEEHGAVSERVVAGDGQRRSAPERRRYCGGGQWRRRARLAAAERSRSGRSGLPGPSGTAAKVSDDTQLSAIRRRSRTRARTDRGARPAGRHGAHRLMETKRLFFALWPDHRQRERLRDVISPVAKTVEGRAVDRRNWHVTLAFIGRFPESRIPGPAGAARAIHRRAVSTELRPPGVLAAAQDCRLVPPTVPRESAGTG